MDYIIRGGREEDPGGYRYLKRYSTTFTYNREEAHIFTEERTARQQASLYTWGQAVPYADMLDWNPDKYPHLHQTGAYRASLLNMVGVASDGVLSYLISNCSPGNPVRQACIQEEQHRRTLEEV